MHAEIRFVSSSRVYCRPYPHPGNDVASPSASVPANPQDKIQHVAALLALLFMGAIAFPEASSYRLTKRLSFLSALIELVKNIPVVHREKVDAAVNSTRGAKPFNRF